MFIRLMIESAPQQFSPQRQLYPIKMNVKRAIKWYPSVINFTLAQRQISAGHKELAGIFSILIHLLNINSNTFFMMKY